MKWIVFYVLMAATVPGIMGVVYNARLTDARSDPRCTFAVSKALLEDHTIRIDAYKDVLGGHHCVRQYNGHSYDYFPLGTSVIVLPVVTIADSLGMDVVGDAGNVKLQKLIVMFIIPAIFIAFYLLGRLYVSQEAAYAIALISVLGSSLTSSLGTALWSQCLSVLLTAIVLLIMARHDEGEAHLNPYLLGGLLFLAYLTRPTASLLVLLVFAYFILKKDWRTFGKTAAASGLLLLGFVGFSLAEYSMVLPPYYINRLTSDSSFFMVLYGLLLSPARGLLTFSPFLLIVIGLAVYMRQSFRRNALFLLLLLWPVVHLIIVSRFPSWFGGWSYGARLLTDSFPAWVLLSHILWREFSRNAHGRKVMVAVVGAYLILGSLAVYGNAVQGLYNPWIQSWNYCMDTFKKKEDALFSWKSAQFLASEDSVKALCIKGGMFPELAYKSPGSCVEFNQRGGEYLRLKFFQDALDDFSAAIIKYPRCVMSYENRARLFFMKRYFDMGCRDLNVACSLGVCGNFNAAREKGFCP